MSLSTTTCSPESGREKEKYGSKTIGIVRILGLTFSYPPETGPLVQEKMLPCGRVFV